MISTSRMSNHRVTVRLTKEDEEALQVVQTQLRPKFPWLNKADLVRAALHEAAIILGGSGIVG